MIGKKRMKKILKYTLISFGLLLILILAYPVGYFVSNPSRVIEETEYAEYKGIVAYVINLDRSKHSFEFVMPNINVLGFPTEKISGIDGKTLPAHEFKNKVDMDAYFKHMNHFPQKGTIDCSLSHIKAWQALLDSPYEYAIIFEDDVKFEPEKLKNTIEELMKEPHLWDLNSFDILHNGTPLTLKTFENKQKMVVYLTNVSHTGCYILNRKAAKRLLEKALPINLPIDHYFTRSWEFGLKFTGIENPRLVHQRFPTSEIARTSRYNEAKPGLLHKAHKVLFQIQTTVIRGLYTINNYLKGK